MNDDPISTKVRHVPAADDGPFDSRAQASARFARFRRTARRGAFGPGFAAESLADTIDVFRGELGRYDLG